MNIHRERVYLCARAYGNDIHYVIFTHEPSESSEYTPLSCMDVQMEIPERLEVVNAVVKTLTRTREAITADLVAKRTMIDGQIQSLLAIEHQEAEA